MRGAARVPTVDALRPIVQPPAVRSRRAEHWTAHVYLRRVSPHLTRRLLLWGADADTVTWLMVAAGVLAGPALLLPGLAGALLAVGLGQLQMLLDCCDGEVARYRGTASARGVFLDKIGHYGAETSIALALGVRAAWHDDASWAVTCGALLALGVVANRAVNDMVHASRAVAGLAPSRPTSATGPPLAGGRGRGPRRACCPRTGSCTRSSSRCSRSSPLWWRPRRGPGHRLARRCRRARGRARRRGARRGGPDVAPPAVTPPPDRAARTAGRCPPSRSWC